MAILPAIVRYTTILHEHGPTSKKARSFRERHATDAKFTRRAKTLDALHAEKESIKLLVDYCEANPETPEAKYLAILIAHGVDSAEAKACRKANEGTTGFAQKARRLEFHDSLRRHREAREAK